MKKILLIATILLSVIGLIVVFYALYEKIRSEAGIQMPHVYQTEKEPADRLDSLSIWHGSQGENWILVTATNSNKILLYDLVTGERINIPELSTINSGILDRPNGIAVVDNLLFVTERGNQRIHVSRLPTFKTVGTFGENTLSEPFGISVFKHQNDSLYTVFVSDVKQESASDNEVQYLPRIHKFSLSILDDNLVSRSAKTFDNPSSDGRLFDVESLIYDSVTDLVIIADESPQEKNVKLFNSEGVFTGRTIGNRIFKYEPEGMALYECDDNGGYLLAADQHKSDNTIHIFDRKTFSWVGSFNNKMATNTDGIYISQKYLPKFPTGVLIMVNNDENVMAISWLDISQKFNLKACIK